MFDFLIVGAGLYGAVFACEAAKRGKKCLVIDKRPHIAGNIYTECVDGINVHKYGAHIFHTSNKEVWDYVNQFAVFNNYVNSPVAVYKDELYNLPFNMNTFSKMWGVKTPEEAESIIAEQIAEMNIGEPKNLEEQALKLVGRDVYEKLIKGYTEKQWGRPCSELPAFIIKRLPLRFRYDNNYFNDLYQGIPIGGYTKIIEKMLANAEVRLNTDYFEFIKDDPKIAEKTVYTGAIDEFFEYRFGALEYRSVRFETEVLDKGNYQGNAVVNYTHRDVPYTRIIEHKHFEFGTQPKTVISREYSAEWNPGAEPYYPINDDRNNALYKQYEQLAAERKDVIFGGRLGTYSYLDMDKVVALALAKANEVLGEVKEEVSLNKQILDELHKIKKTESENNWANVFHDTIVDSTWLLKKSFSPGRWAVGYPFLYVLYRVLDEFRPKRILELGLGQSTKMIGQYAANCDISEHIVTEHDTEWINFFKRSFELSDKTEIHRFDIKNINFKGKDVLSYWGFKTRFTNRKFDLICIDAPFGGNRGGEIYARVDVCRLLPRVLEPSFVIMLDDVERTQDKNTSLEIKKILTKSGIRFKSRYYHGEKDLFIITSEDLGFLCSL